MLYQLPNDLTVVAVGGCGKKLLSKLYEHEWFLEKYMAHGKNLALYSFDTDSDQEPDDTKRVEEVNKKIEDIRKTHNLYGGTIKCEHYHLPNLANVNRVSDLASEDICNKMKAFKGGVPDINFWWMNDPENNFKYADLKKFDPGNVTDDFSGGVHRRRAISKAVLSKAIVEGSDFPTMDFIGAAIIVGLGGGTGSGMFIDLARYIKQHGGNETHIDLFAVLPSTNEGDKEQLNAAIALTELEYLNLQRGENGERLFNRIIVSSLDPTGYTDGRCEAEAVDRFDSAFTYTLINALHLTTADVAGMTDAMKDYSGFIFGDSHVIEYPVEELRSHKKGDEGVNDFDLSVLDYDEEGKAEIEKLCNKVNMTYPKLLESSQIGVRYPVIRYKDTEQWRFRHASLVVASKSHMLTGCIQNDTNSDSITRNIKTSLSLTNDANPLDIKCHNYTKPWEISLSLFASASFLDNIAPLVAGMGGGYWETYEREKDNILHHALFLQEGKYVVRNKLLELNEAAEISDLEYHCYDSEDAAEARKRILDLYTVKDIRDAVSE